NPERSRVGTGIGPGRTGALLHHVAKLTREHELALAAHGGCFDEHDVAADGRVVHAGSHADFVSRGGLFRVHLGTAEQVGHPRRMHIHAGGPLTRNPARYLPRHLADFPLELSDARFTSVARDDSLHRRIAKAHRMTGEAVLLELARNEVAPRDLELLALGV